MRSGQWHRPDAREQRLELVCSPRVSSRTWTPSGSIAASRRPLRAERWVGRPRRDICGAYLEQLAAAGRVRKERQRTPQRPAERTAVTAATDARGPRHGCKIAGHREIMARPPAPGPKPKNFAAAFPPGVRPSRTERATSSA